MLVLEKSLFGEKELLVLPPGCTLFVTLQQLTSLYFSPGVGRLFTRRARFGKTVQAAGCTLIGKEGEDLFLFFFLEVTVHVRM